MMNTASTKGLWQVLLGGAFLIAGPMVASDAVGQDYGETCPADTLAGQDPHMAGAKWH